MLINIKDENYSFLNDLLYFSTYITDLSLEEIEVAKRYPTRTALCIRDGWEFCHPELADGMNYLIFNFLLIQLCEANLSHWSYLGLLSNFIYFGNLLDSGNCSSRYFPLSINALGLALFCMFILVPNDFFEL